MWRVRSSSVWSRLSGSLFTEPFLMKQVKRSKCVILWFHLFSGISVDRFCHYSMCFPCSASCAPQCMREWFVNVHISALVTLKYFWCVFSFYFMLVFRREFNHMQKELLREQTRCKILEEELQKPLQVHRWRKLEVMREDFVFPKPLLSNQWPSKSLFHLLLCKWYGGTGQTEISIVPMESLPAECLPCTMQSVLFLCHFLSEKLQGNL